jgi:hypothetical protein
MGNTAHKAPSAKPQTADADMAAQLSWRVCPRENPMDDFNTLIRLLRNNDPECFYVTSTSREFWYASWPAIADMSYPVTHYHA